MPIYNYIKTFDPGKEKQLKTIIKNAEERTHELEEKIKKVDSLLNQARQRATEGEIFKYGNFFGEEANKNLKSSKINLGLMMGSIVLTIVLSIVFLQKIQFIQTEDANFWENLLNTVNSQNILIKFVILSLGGSI